MKMTRKKRLQHLKRLVAVWQLKLQLPYWQVTCKWESGEELREGAGYDAKAGVHFDVPRQIAVISFNRDVDWNAPDDAPDGPAGTHAVVHELCHVVLAAAGMNSALDDMLCLAKPHLPFHIYDALGARAIAAREAACDTLTRMVRRK